MKYERYSTRDSRRHRGKRHGSFVISILIFVAAVALVVLVIKAMPIGNSSETLDSYGDELETAGEKNDFPQIDLNDWKLILVNDANPLPDGYVPQLSTLSNELEFDSRAIGYLEDMLAAAKKDGYELVVCSGYRSVEFQSELFEQQVEKQQAQGELNYAEAVEAAKTVVTYPGHSEHNLGLAADIVCKNYQLLDDGFANRPEAKWLMDHCAEYGFILRYPEDKMDVTGVIYESWHFRYVGQESASYIMDHGLCLEEYLALAKS